MAELSAQEKNHSETLERLRLANLLRFNAYETVVAHGNANFEVGKDEPAEQWYAAALRRKPGDANVRADFGSTLCFREPPDLTGAVREFRLALEGNPINETALQNLIAALTRKNEFAEARAQLSRLESINPQNRLLDKLRANLKRQSSESKNSAVNRQTIRFSKYRLNF